MKKLFTLTILCILSAIILSSCGSGLSITKRRYTKGYYVNKTPKHGETKEVIAAKTTKTAAEPVAIQVMPELKKQAGKQAHETETTNNQPASLTATHAQKVTAARESKKQINKQSNTAKAFADFSVKKPIKSIDKAIENYKLTAGSEDGLSLFWIVILVLLILWALGFISGNFGGIINILLIIALILLILWLLRVL